MHCMLVLFRVFHNSLLLILNWYTCMHTGRGIPPPPSPLSLCNIHIIHMYKSNSLKSSLRARTTHTHTNLYHTHTHAHTHKHTHTRGTKFPCIFNQPFLSPSRPPCLKQQETHGATLGYHSEDRSFSDHTETVSFRSPQILTELLSTNRINKQIPIYIPTLAVQNKLPFSFLFFK